MRGKSELQSLNIKQLNSRIARLSISEEKVDATIELAQRNAKTDTAKAIELFAEALNLSRRLRYSKGELSSLLRLATLTDSYLHDYNQSLEYSRAAKDLAHHMNDISALAKALRSQASVYSSLGNYDLALSLLNECLNLQNELNEEESINFTRTDLGILWWSQGNYSEAKTNFEQALQYFLRTENQYLIAGITHNLAVLESETGHYHEAITGLEKSIAVKKDIGDRAGLSLSLATLGTQYIHLQDFETAVSLFLESFHLRNELGLEPNHTTLNNIAYAYSRLLEYEMALEYYQKAYDSAKNTGDSINARDYTISLARINAEIGAYERCATLLNSLSAGDTNNLNATSRLHHDLTRARLLAYSGDIDNGIQLIRDALVLSKTIGNSYLQIRALLTYAEILLNGKLERQTIEVCNEAIEMIHSSSENILLRDTYRILHAAYSSLADFENAYRYLQLHFELQTSFLNACSARHVRSLMVQYDTDLAKRESALNKTRLDIMEREMEHKKNELIAIALHLVRKNEFLVDVRDNIAANINDTNAALKTLSSMINTTMGDGDWNLFEQQFVNMNPEFLKRLTGATSESLTPSELKVCQLLRTGLNTKEIASILFVSKRTIDTHRHNINKKLKIKDVNLTSWLVSL
jgi:tetratricopeptide (TPR) repeat protein/DNA-binding CsgD family transcriptional regulator